MSITLVDLGDVLTLKRGYDLPYNKRKMGNIPIVSSSGISGWHNVAKKKGPGVITGRCGTLGRVYYVIEDYWPLNTALYVMDFQGNMPKYCCYLLENLLYKIKSNNSAVPGLNRNVLHKIKVRVFLSRSKQEKIVTALSAYDDLIENNRQRIRLLEESARLIYREWFVNLRFPGWEDTKIIDGLPEGWERTKINHICQTIGGGTPSTKKKEYWENGNILWATPSDLTKNESFVLLDTDRKITYSGLKNSSAKIVPPKTILMTSRASIGYFALMEKEVCTNQGFINIIPNEHNTRMYILFNLLNRVEEIILNASGTTFKEISKGRFREMKISVPDSKVLAKFKEIANSIYQQMLTLSKSNSLLKQARDILLPRLMNGEIEV